MDDRPRPTVVLLGVSCPDTLVDTKAVAALCLGVLAAATGWALGGIVPATIALVLAGQASSELTEGQGWRTGGHYVLWARRLAWTGLVSAAIALVIVLIIGLWQATTGIQDFPSTVD